MVLISGVESIDYDNSKNISDIKTQSFHGRNYHLQVLMSNSPSFAYCKDSHGFYDGIDIQILKMIAKKLGVHIDYSTPSHFNQLSALDIQ